MRGQGDGNFVPVVVVSLLFVYVSSRRCCLDVLVMVYLVVKWGV